MADRRTVAALLVAGCYFMENLDGTIVLPALAPIAKDLGATVAGTTLLVSVYFVTLAVAIPAGGRVARRIGARRMLLLAIGGFVLTSAFCALATSLPMLVAGRVLQGLAAACMVPVGRTIVLSTAARSDVVRLTAFLIWPGLLAPPIAPVLGQALLQVTSWRAVFLINVPIGVGLLIGVLLVVREVRDVDPPRFDVIGSVLLAAALGATLWAADEIAGGDGVPAVAWGIGAFACWIVASWWLRRAESPIVRLDLLRDRVFRAASRGGGVYWSAVTAMPVALTLLLQTSPDPWRLAAVLGAVFAGNVAIKPATTELLRRFSYRAVLTVATTAFIGSTLVTALTLDAAPIGWLVLAAAVGGAARSVGLTAWSTLLYGGVAPGDFADASVFAASAQQLYPAVGAVLATAAVTGAAAVAGSSVLTPLLACGALALLAAITLLEIGGLPHGAGDDLRPRRAPRQALG